MRKSEILPIMSDPFIVKLNEKHLCTWYMLPLLNLNVQSFGNINFINAFIVRKASENPVSLVAVQVADKQLCPGVLSNKFFHSETMLGEKEYLLFRIPKWWRDDYHYFLQGQYSKMSDEAKQKIREVSGLKYEVPDEFGNKITDAILMALDNHKVLRNKWIDLLDISAFWLPEESLSVLAESSFITIKDL